MVYWENKLNLYKATELARLESHIDEETGEIDMVAFDAAQITLIEKQRSVVAYMRNISAKTAMIKAAAKELADKAKQSEAQLERMKDYLIAGMKMSGATKIEAVDGTFSATLFLDRDESVVIQDGSVFAPELCNDPKPPEPSKSKIKAAILAGQAVANAAIVRSHRLTIK